MRSLSEFEFVIVQIERESCSDISSMKENVSDSIKAGERVSLRDPSVLEKNDLVTLESKKRYKFHPRGRCDG